MKKFYLFHNEIYLEIICEDIYEKEIREHFCGDMVSDNANVIIPFYTLIIVDKVIKTSGIKECLVNEVFGHATMDCWIDNEKKICCITGFVAKTEIDKILCIRYFCSNMFNRLLELNGYIGIHSSCVNYNGTGIAFVGKRMAGKTTCMLAMIDAGVDLICNDIAAMRYLSDKNQVDAYGVPNDVFIRMCTDFCQQKYSHKYIALAQLQGVECNKISSLTENRIMLTHKILADLNKVALFSSTRIDLVIIPKYVSGLNKPVFTKCNEETIVKHFCEQEIELIHDSTLFLYRLKLPENNNENMWGLAKHLSQLPCFYCEYSENTIQEAVVVIKRLCKELKC